MATTEVHVLVLHPIGEDNDSTYVYTGWTPEAARQAFLDEQREAVEDDPDGVWPYSTWQEWLDGEGNNRYAWYWREEVHHLPA